jgi:hypothetical protein
MPLVILALFSALVGVGVGTLCGWRLCRGLTLAQHVTTLDGDPVVRVTLDPGAWPWSGARVAFVDPATPGLEIE